ncbi:hypothetical protein CC1G_05994 [Coprinopsis cinerea okayama7|uniref:Uncharacterized protein n=1 Tax=Coprinopsis cinerea (strain Okayama-7 / 130 / ATCC MYA-4618 / FGSC 9003) TaxID=240176 RepID=A8N4L6_COPC7|nr:hypothetical protein CC1G_05994 [Coprinopsis cinerea okayama7\|eukprot:XP_001829785.2 hypothetical protein CC1G_05994 [Coprinopsis cinerea okayama7\
MHGRPWAAVLFLTLATEFGSALAKVVPFLDAGFSFDPDYSGGRTAPVPITREYHSTSLGELAEHFGSAQCEAIELKWGRNGAKGTPPTAPYFLQVLSSESPHPFIIPAGAGPKFEWRVPFSPGTQYQICIYDTFGVSGGCRALYTVVPPSSNTTTCEQLTAPPSPLNATVSPMSGPEIDPPVPLIDQCSDLSVKPRNGSPPFTLTVSPSFHPPVNITSDNMNAINWTVALPEGFPFFLSLASADGLVWSRGPLHARSGRPDCLSPSSIPKTTFTTTAVGSSIGSFIVGILLGGLSSFLFFRYRKSSRSKLPPIISKHREIPPPEHVISPPLPIQDPPSRQGTPQPISYPPPPSLPNSPPQTPDQSEFGFRSTSSRTHSIDPFDISVSSTASSNFPLDNKRRYTMDRQSSHHRAGSITTQASSSQLTTVSSSNSSAPLLQSRRTSRSSRLTRAPTYVRRPPPTHMSVSELITDDASLIAGNTVDDLPPQYMRNPREEEVSVAGGL